MAAMLGKHVRTSSSKDYCSDARMAPRRLRIFKIQKSPNYKKKNYIVSENPNLAGYSLEGVAPAIQIKKAKAIQGGSPTGAP